MDPDLEVSRTIAAPPATVFAALADVTRMGEWSPETTDAAWHEGVNGPGLGASYTATNRLGDREWTTDATIVEFVQDERFIFECSFAGYHFATWGYAVEAAPGGSLVTELWQDHRNAEAIEGSKAISGVEDRIAHNRAGMETTLERLAAAVE